MALTKDKKLAEKIWRLRTQGITNDKKKMKQKESGEIWNYEQIELGYNYRMNDLQAALGYNQMKRLDKSIIERHKIANIYDDELKNLPFTTPYQLSDTYSSYHLYPIFIKNEKKNLQKKIYKELRKKKIGVNLHYIPVHRHFYYEKFGFKKNDFPVAEKFHKRAIMIPMYSALKFKEQSYVIESIKKIFKN